MMSLTAWAATVALVVGLCALELVIAVRRPEPPGFAAALRWSLFYVGLALAFGVVLGVTSGWELGGEYFAGFIVEKSLSIDNLFVFVIIVGSFAVPEQLRSRVVMLGIVAALLLRCVFIALGAALIASFAVSFAIFGAVLIVTAVQLLRRRGEPPSAHGSGIAGRLAQRLPVSGSFGDGRLMTRVDGRRVATPMLLVLAAMGVTDALFALDSIPAVYGVTDDPFVVFAANAFALLGLRPLYFLVSGLVERLVFLADGMAAILGFIGVKLILEFVHGQVPAVPHIPTGPSLLVIVVILVVTGVASLLQTRRRDHAERSGAVASRSGGAVTRSGANPSCVSATTPSPSSASP
jgi:tellurite resistance protein TerC